MPEEVMWYQLAVTDRLHMVSGCWTRRGRTRQRCPSRSGRWM